MLETRTVVVSGQVLRRKDGDWVPSQIWGGAHAQRSEWAGDEERGSLKARSVWGSRRMRASPSQKGMRKMSTLLGVTVSLVRGTGSRAIGGGRGWACVGGRAIGGDALAMQVHARPWRHLPTLISAAHARRKYTLGRLLRRRGDAGWRGSHS